MLVQYNTTIQQGKLKELDCQQQNETQNWFEQTCECTVFIVGSKYLSGEKNFQFP